MQLTVTDIEDLLELGSRHKFCPYFMSRELKHQADIVFMPYNYLLDPLIRKVLGVELSNSVVILDEGHNIEKNCEEGASFQIKTSDIALAIEDVTGAMKLISTDMPLDFSEEPKEISPEDLCCLKQILLDFEKELDNIPLNHQPPEGTNFDGTYIYTLLEKAGIKTNNFHYLIAVTTNIIQFLTTVSRNGPFARKGVGLQVFENFLTLVFSGTSDEFREKVKMCYKVHIMEEEVKKKRGDSWMKVTSKFGGRVLSYWCFNPGFGMDMLMDKGLRCLILTSGTLAPLRPLISELGLNVQVRLENPHVVKGDQICVKIISSGPDSEILNSNYQNRDNPKYLSSLGRSVLNLCRVIPNGLLIFFPSYPTMAKCEEHWRETGLWGNICQIKPILTEPKDKHAFSNAMTDYYSKIGDPTLKGAIFMGVCRGKLSEGLDFADANGRAFLKGNDWYTLEATRAVNQAVGRVIRHRHDYGAILLLDTKFNYFNVKSQMSKWLQDHIRVVNNFGEAMRDLRVFFKNAEAKFPVTNKPPASSNVPAEFEMLNVYKKNKFDSSISSQSLASTSSSESMDGEVVIHKRISSSILTNNSKRKKNQSDTK
ncbi:hypothetical protein NQ317_003493 [Molorchus minor]|uniref:Helicase ATP-binding domain-containing protein n=1 Tax=Molorchus minor TaxID=1323400 RepID=A0ABQ9J144_9CUCU|nr:hypothetical protein NQ317_003493 [Molorchus minor]